MLYFFGNLHVIGLKILVCGRQVPEYIVGDNLAEKMKRRERFRVYFRRRDETPK